MRCWSVFLLLHIFVGVWSDDTCETEPSCEAEEMSEIGRSLQQERFPTEDFLNEHCRVILSSIDCSVDFSERCPEKVEKVDVTALLKGMLGYTNDLCTEGTSTRTNYLENVECYQKLIENFVNCSVKTDQILDRFLESQMSLLENEIVSFEEIQIKRGCMYIVLGKQCIFSEIFDSCGRASLAAPNEVFERVISLVTKNLCPREKMQEYSEEFLKFAFVNLISKK